MKNPYEEDFGSSAASNRSREDEITTIQADEVLRRAIKPYAAAGWTLIYQTRALADGAIGGVDSILMKVDVLHRLVPFVCLACRRRS